jgi:hypothetical protein
MPGADLSGLDRIDWASIKHAFGPATDVPGLIRTLVTPEEEIRRGAWGALYNNLNHQGTISQATSVTAPFFIALLQGDGVPGKSEILMYLAAIAAHAEVAVGLMPSTALFESLAQANETAACLVLAALEAHDANLAMLVERLYDAQEDPTVRAHMLWALGKSATPLSDAQLERLMEGIEDPSPAVRFAAVVGACRLGKCNDACEKVLVETVLEPQGVDAWLETSPWDTGNALELAIRFLSDLGKERIAEHYGKLVEALERHRANKWVARVIMLFLIENLFPEKMPDSSAELGTLEVRVLSVMRDDTSLQKQTAASLASHGLPATQEELDAFLKTNGD